MLSTSSLKSGTFVCWTILSSQKKSAGPGPESVQLLGSNLFARSTVPLSRTATGRTTRSLTSMNHLDSACFIAKPLWKKKFVSNSWMTRDCKSICRSTIRGGMSLLRFMEIHSAQLSLWTKSTISRHHLLESSSSLKSSQQLARHWPRNCFCRWLSISWKPCARNCSKSKSLSKHWCMLKKVLKESTISTKNIDSFHSTVSKKEARFTWGT